MYLVINKWVTAVKISNFSGHCLRNRSTLDIGVLGYIGKFDLRNTLPKSHTFLLLHCVYARSLAEHDVKLREVLDRLRTYKLKLQPEKWISPERGELHEPPNYGGQGAAGPSKGSGNRVIPHTHQSETAESLLWYDQLLLTVHPKLQQDCVIVVYALKERH